jgi:hypothetical protein
MDPALCAASPFPSKERLMTEYDLLLDEPAEETQDASAAPQAETLDAPTPVTPVFSAPVLDRIRASD